MSEVSSNLLEVVVETVVKASDVRIESSSPNYNLTQIDEIYGTELSGTCTFASISVCKTALTDRFDMSQSNMV